MGTIAEQQARRPHIVATTFLVVLFLPLLISLLMSGAYMADFLAGGDITRSQAASFAPLGVAGLGAFASYIVLKKRNHTVKQAWVWSVITIVLLLVAALPMIYSIGLAFNEQWCEYQPGGRGMDSVADLEDIPRSCR